MKKFFLINIIFLSLFSYNYSEVTSKISSFSNTFNVKTGGAPITFYGQNIVVTRNFISEDMIVHLQDVELFEFKDPNWVKFKMDKNSNLKNSYGTEIEMTNIRENGQLIPLNQKRDGTIELQWHVTPFRKVTADFTITIKKGTPDFTSINLGSYYQVGIESNKYQGGTLTLETEEPLVVDVPDIDFGDVLTTSKDQTRSGNIMIKGSTDTSISIAIKNPNFKLYAIGNTDDSIIATANIDGKIASVEAIKANQILIKKLNVTISDFSNLPSGSYGGDLIIDINSN